MICKYKKCKTMASFNFKGEDERAYCSAHKLKGMENVRYKFCAHGMCRKTRMSGEKTCRKHRVNDDASIKFCANILMSFKLKDYVM